MKINIAIDGPSGAGKSTISDILASKLHYVHLDTGAMYRAVAYMALQRGIRLDDEANLVNLIDDLKLDMKTDGRVFCNGEDISDVLHTGTISMAASDVSKLKGVRAALVVLQRKIASSKGYIVDGRDICAVVLPDAELKIFLTASLEDRANRRFLQNKENGVFEDYETVLADLKKRDHQDTHRDNSPLCKTDDAFLLDSSGMSIEEVVDKILAMVSEVVS